MPDAPLPDEQPAVPTASELRRQPAHRGPHPAASNALVAADLPGLVEHPAGRGVPPRGRKRRLVGVWPAAT